MLSFTPHLVPMKRGMLATIYAKLDGGGDSGSGSKGTAGGIGTAGGNGSSNNSSECGCTNSSGTTGGYISDSGSTSLDAGKLLEIYREYYKGEFFVRILNEGQLPETKYVAGSNCIDIGLVVDKRLNRAIVLSAIDNLGKGASAQAVQVLNIMCGYPENTGLANAGLYL